MNNEIHCSIVNDLLPLYVDGLTSEVTNPFVEKHLEECQECQKQYKMLKAELRNTADGDTHAGKIEINYLKKVRAYQKMNLILGAVVSFLLGASIPAVKVGMPILMKGTIPEYYLARLQIAWHIGLLKMTISGICVCAIYMLIMLCVRRKIK